MIFQIQNAIYHRKKIKLEYFSIRRRGSSERIIHPYIIYNYEGFLYMAAYCENNNEFRDFKLIRIENLKVLDKEFVQMKFDFNKFMEGSFGIFKDKELSVVLRIKYPFSIYVKESVFIENQEIEELKNGDIIFKAIMKGKPDIMSWINSMGANVEIL